jgi:lantibiotic biosynthesis protein
LKEKITTQFNQIHTLISKHQPTNDGLFGGSLGLALYYYNLYQAHGVQADADKAIGYVETTLQKINDGQLNIFGHSFCNGLAGLGYMINELKNADLVEMDIHEEFAELDQLLYQSAKHQLQHSNQHDFLHGAMGIIYYFVTRLPDATIAGYTYELVQLFCDKAVYTDKGIWFKNFVVKEDKDEEINFSLSHGQSSFLIVLALAYHKGITVEHIPLLLEKGVELLLHYKRDPNIATGDYSIFPTSVQDATIHFSVRLAWCYGDLNVVLAILHAATVLNKPDWFDMANDIALETIKRNDSITSGATDSHLCHGSLGLAQLYKSLFELTEIDAYKEAWEHWVHFTATEFVPQELATNFYKDKECDLLEGWVGVNLAYLTYLSDKELSWNKIMLL